MNRYSFIALAVGLILVGCTTPDLPRGARFVGGGILIDYRAPSDGTVILRERTSRKIIATGSLEAGHNFEFRPDRDNAGELLANLFRPASIGMDAPLVPTNAFFELYFVPAKPR